MEVSTVLLSLAGVWQLLNTAGVLTIVWRWARMVERVDQTLVHLAATDERIIKMLDALELRVGHLEGRK